MVEKEYLSSLLGDRARLPDHNLLIADFTFEAPSGFENTNQNLNVPSKMVKRNIISIIYQMNLCSLLILRMQYKVSFSEMECNNESPEEINCIYNAF